MYNVQNKYSVACDKYLEPDVCTFQLHWVPCAISGCLTNKKRVCEAADTQIRGLHGTVVLDKLLAV